MLPAKELAKSFVPELVSKHLYLCNVLKMTDYESRTDIIFNPGYCDFGPK
jgi:hypothetical protein